MNLNDLRMSLKAALDNMWARIDARITAIEQGGGGGGVTSVNGQTGDVSITPANLGAVAKAGDTMTGDLTVQHSGEVNINAVCTNTNAGVALESAPSGNHGIWSYGYWNGSNYVSDGKWMIYRGTNGRVIVNDVGKLIRGVGSCYISNQQPNSKNAMTTDGTTPWYVTLEPGVYIVNIWCREQDQGGGDTYKAVLWFGDGSADQTANYQSPNWGIHNFSIIVAPTSNTTYNLYHEHNGQTHTVDARISIVRLQ